MAYSKETNRSVREAKYDFVKRAREHSFNEKQALFLLSEIDFLIRFLTNEITTMEKSSKNSNEVSDVMNQIFIAFVNEGVNPEYHRKIKGKLKAEWPLLYRAIESLIALYSKV